MTTPTAGQDEAVQDGGGEAVCGHCGGPLPAQRTGRPARYCSQSCRQAAHRATRRAEAALADADRLRPQLDREAALLGRLAEAVVTAADPDSTGVEPAITRLLATTQRLAALARGYRTAEHTARTAGLRRAESSSPAHDETSDNTPGTEPAAEPAAVIRRVASTPPAEPRPDPDTGPPPETKPVPAPPPSDTAPRGQRAWDALNARQRTYLLTLYQADQSLEKERRHLAARGDFTRAPARMWRRIDFNGEFSPVAGQLRAAGMYDSGAGATLAALRTRGLIDTETTPGLLNELVYVWLTRAGRAAARAHLGTPPTRQKPRWALSEWLWQEMAKVAHAGPTGLPATELYGTAHLYLDDGHTGAHGNRPYLHATRTAPTTYHYHLTPTGHTHYTDHLTDYRHLYPHIDAPDTPPDITLPHR